MALYTGEISGKCYLLLYENEAVSKDMELIRKIFCCHSLGSTRFFKVARARSQEGLIVVKVFVIHDPTLPLSTYKEKLEDIRSQLASAVNCLPFQRMIVSIIAISYKYIHYTYLGTQPELIVCLD